MIYDIHVHAVGNGMPPALRRSTALRRIERRLKVTSALESGSGCVTERILSWVNESIIDHAVLLALDAAYRDDGKRDDNRTLIVTGNDFVADLAAEHDKVLFGASIHPYRRDSIQELERLVGRGACLVKWLPSAQNIRPDDDRCYPFYEAMAHYQIPLLCHTGIEHTLTSFSNALNDPVRLTPALERGVTVIAAHCGARIYLHEKSFFRNWREMTLRYERLYGDISAFGVITRMWTLRGMLKSPELTARLVFGSDFPVPPMPWTCTGFLGLHDVRRIQNMSNPFDQAVALIKAAGVPDEVFSRAGSLLRLPEKGTKVESGGRQ